MRISILLLLFGVTVSSAASSSKIPKKIRGLYRCEMPSYEIEHNGAAVTVEATRATLLVYESRVVLNIGGKLFSSSVVKRKPSKNTRHFDAQFDTPFGPCIISFTKKPKSATIDLPMFNKLIFYKTK